MRVAGTALAHGWLGVGGGQRGSSPDARSARPRGWTWSLAADVDRARASTDLGKTAGAQARSRGPSTCELGHQ